MSKHLDAIEQKKEKEMKHQRKECEKKRARGKSAVGIPNMIIRLTFPEGDKDLYCGVDGRNVEGLTLGARNMGVKFFQISYRFGFW